MPNVIGIKRKSIMVHQLRHWKKYLIAFFATVIAIGFAPGSAHPGTPSSVQSTLNVVTPQWLYEHAGDPDLKVLDVRINPLDYIISHVPEAVHIADNTFRGPNGRLPIQYWEREKLATLFSQAGVNDNSHVVVYSDGANVLGASMVAYLLERSGHSQVSILDGGYQGYRDAGFPVTKEFPQYEPGSFALRDDPSIRVTLDQVRQYLNDPEITFIDPRPAALFAGEEDVFIRNGHIPGAKNIPWQSVTTGDVNLHQLKPLDEIRALFASRGITSSDDIIMTCSTGREATLQYWVLKHLLGYPNVRIYEGSWTEYSSYPDLPMETGRDLGI
jgi:thiosulfate/3-mercaptopyruvate sulfurtransferase